VGDGVVFVVTATVLIIGLSAFFVAVEFAVLSAKRHRLEDGATKSRAARAALRNSNELTVLLAGSQLGITLCTLALGAITKPAVHHWLEPVFAALGVPALIADVVAFVLALFIVTFLHLVIGEMAPKSWAIAHPELSATMLALPMRAFMAVTRPLLRVLNGMANGLVRRVGVDPADTLEGTHNAENLRYLVEHSVNVGVLDERLYQPISTALEMQILTLADLIQPDKSPACVRPDAPVGELQEMSRRTGHLRILVGIPGRIIGVVHVRDTLTSPADELIAGFTRPVCALDAGMTLHSALSEMRATRNHLVVVTREGSTLGVVTMSDVLRRLVPQSMRRATV
jgi:CBS domain containing-hemolysin-like protein